MCASTVAACGFTDLAKLFPDPRPSKGLSVARYSEQEDPTVGEKVKILHLYYSFYREDSNIFTAENVNSASV